MDTPSATPHVIRISDLFHDAVALYRNRFSVFAAIMAVPLAIAFAGAFTRRQFIATIVLGLVSVLAYLFAYIALIAAAKGENAEAAYRLGGSLFLSYAWVVFLTSLVNLGGLIMGFVPAVIFSIWFAFAPLILIDAGSRGMEALLRSKEYVRGLWWPIFWRVIIVGILIGLFSVGIAKVSELGNQSFAAYIGPAIVQFFALPFVVTFGWVLYQNLKVLKPGLAGAPTQEKGKGFFIFSAVLGIVAPAILLTGVTIAYLSFLKDPCASYAAKRQPCPISPTNYPEEFFDSGNGAQ